METKDTLAKTPETLGYNPLDLMYAQVAGEYLNQGTEEGVALAQKSLEKILEKRNLENWNSKTVQDPNIIQKTIKNQLDDYNAYKSNQTIGELIKYNGKSLDKYVEGGSQRVQEELSEFVDMKYGDVEKEIAIAKYIIDGEKLGVRSKEEVEKAKEKIQKYQKVALTIEMASQRDLSKFKSEVEDNAGEDSLKKVIKELYPVREKVE